MVRKFVASRRSCPERVERLALTQNQLIELIESEQVKALVERSEERGFIEPAEFEAFVLEHDLTEDETEQLTRELETLGLEVGQSRAARTRPRRRRRTSSRRPSPSPPAPPTACSSSSPTSAATSC